MPRGSASSSTTLAPITEKELPLYGTIISPSKSKVERASSTQFSARSSELIASKKASRRNRGVTLEDVTDGRFATDNSNSLCGVDNEEVIDTATKLSLKPTSRKVVRLGEEKRKGEISQSALLKSYPSRKRQSLLMRYFMAMTGIGQVPIIVVKEQSLQAIRSLQLQQWHLAKLRRRFDDIDVDHSGSIDRTEFMVSIL